MMKQMSQKSIEILEKLTIPSIDELASAGVLYGESKNKTNPKMVRYIYKDETITSDMWVIDLDKTYQNLRKACEFLFHEASKGKKILFVGTKESCKELIAEAAESVGMPYVSNKWAPGLLTNFNTILGSIRKKQQIEDILSGKNTSRFKTKKEKAVLARKLKQIVSMYNGIESMKELPTSLFIIGGNEEMNAIKEARKMGINIVGLFDTDCNPEGIQYVIPGNDDSINSVKIIINTLMTFVQEGIKYYASNQRTSISSNMWKEKHGGVDPRPREFRSEFKPRPFFKNNKPRPDNLQ